MEKFSSVIKREIPITDYAARLGFTLVRKGKYYSLKEHDSVIIDTDKNCFWRNSVFSKGFSGGAGSVIDFAMEFAGAADAREALRQLSELYGIHGESDRAEVERKPKTKAVGQKKERPQTVAGLEKPKKADNNKSVFRYLIAERKIQRSVIRYFLAKNMLYQDERRNCVFRTDVFGCVRSTGEKRFVRDLEGCDYDECFYFRGSNAAKGLIVAESVIDIMSVMSYFTLKEKKYTDFCYLALSGTNKLESIFHHLKKEGTAIDTIFLAFDNDKAGHKAVGQVQERAAADFPEIRIKTAFPPQGKDWNDYIKAITPDEDGSKKV